MKAFALFAALLFVPGVTAWHLSSFPDPDGRETVDIRNRVIATNAVNIDNGAAGNLMTYTFPWDPEFSFTDTPSHTIRATFSYTIQHPSTSNGAWTVQAAKETTGNLASCSVRVETVDPIGISLDAVPLAQYYRWDCFFTQSANAHPHNHTVYVNRTVASGTPSNPTAESISVRLETEDVVVTDTGINEITEAITAFFPLIILLGLVLWAETKREFMLYVLACVAGALATLTLSTEVAATGRLLIVAITVFMAIRAYYARKDIVEEQTA